jgi:Major Facilitator Superfamily
MAIDSRKVAVATAGFCTFLNLYSPQALLPALSREFGVGAAEISTIMTASTLAIAVTAPFTGAIADVLGRKRVIAAAMLAVVVPMVGASFAPDVQALIAWRFVQGLLLPPIFGVTVAYIGDEWPPAQVAGVAGIYIAGSSLGGFCGRFLPGLLGDLFGWRAAFLALAGLSLVGAVMVALVLPREKGFVRSPGLLASARQMLRHLKDPQLLATYGIGFGVLQFYRCVHVRKFSSRRAALSFLLDAARLDFCDLSRRYRDRADDRLDDGAARAPALRPCGHCRVGRRRVAHAARATSGDHRGTNALRGVRHAVPDDFDRLCDGNRQGRPLVGGGSLRDLVLCRRQHGRLPAWAGLGVGRMAGRGRHGARHARGHGHHCRARLSERDGLGSIFQAQGGHE